MWSIRVKGLIETERRTNMEDKMIVDLYWARSENAISETEKKYGKYCFQIAHHILPSSEDSEECVNDTYLRAWNSIPPHRPSMLKAFLGKITRNLALNRYKNLTAEKRNSGQIPAVLEELQDCIPGTDDPERIIDDLALSEIFNRFLGALSSEQRKIFMRRYWYLCPVKEIAAGLGVGESKVKMSLLRSRNELKKRLEKEGILL